MNDSQAIDGFLAAGRGCGAGLERSFCAGAGPGRGREYLSPVTGEMPANLTKLPKGPDIQGIISARKGGQIQVTTANGSNTAILVSQATQIRSSGGFLGLDKNKLGADALLNGLPVTVKTVQYGGSLVATQVRLKQQETSPPRR